MKAYIQYIDRGVVTGNLIEACGDRAVFQLDGRQSLETWINDGRANNGFNRPQYAGFKVMKGDLKSAICLHEEIF